MTPITEEEKRELVADLDVRTNELRVYPNERAPAISAEAHKEDKAMAGAYLTSNSTTNPAESQEVNMKKTKHQKRVERAQLALVKGRDLQNMVLPEPVWIIPEYLPAGLTFLAGKSKLGKSWLALQIAGAVATGGMAFGKQVSSGRVLYLALEDSLRRMQSRMKIQCWPNPLPDNFDFYTWHAFVENVGSLNLGGSAILRDLVEEGNYRYVVIDTYSKSIAKDQNESDTVTLALSPLHSIANELDMSIMIIDHHKKAADEDWVSDISGSTAKGAISDTIWGLYRQRHKKDAKLRVLGRDLDEKTLDLNFAGDIGTWQVTGTDESPMPTKLQQVILDCIEEIGPSTNQELSKAMDKAKGNIYNELQELLGKGFIKKDDLTKRYILVHNQHNLA